MRKILIFSMALIVFTIFSSSAQKRVVSTPKEIPIESKTLSSENPERSLKRMVAIGRFSNETQYAKSIFYDKENDPVGRQAMDVLSTKLAASGKFILLERSDLEQLLKEVNEGGGTFEKVGADFIIVGSVSEFGRKTEGQVKLTSRTKTQTATATVNIRLVEVKTGRIIYSEEATGEATTETKTVMGMGSSADYDSALNDQAISAAISKLVDNVINNLMDNPWRAYFLAVQENNYIISGGKSQGIQVGDIFTVIKKGDKVKNPQTNMFIELPGAEVGELRVNQLVGNNIDDEVSFATLLSGSINEAEISLYFIEQKK
jgi:curli biogenesis system outer membrane secretion channel CsgG